MDIVKFLQRFEELYNLIGDTYRAKAYHKAANMYKDNAQEKIGKSIMAKIEEYKKTGKCVKLEELTKLAQPYQILGKILGVGTATINDWVKLGITDLVTLRRAIIAGKVALNNTQSYGLKYYEHLNQKIPRATVTSIANDIKRIVTQLFPKSQFMICGSYRRGSATSGDIDILLSNVSLSILEDAIVYIPNYIATIAAGNEKLTILYMDNNAICRQIDIFNATDANYYAFLVYLTGDKYFEQKLRSYAKHRGYKLNQTGLYRNDKLIACKNEKDVFDKLGIKYIDPQYRTQDVQFEII